MLKSCVSPQRSADNIRFKIASVFRAVKCSSNGVSAFLNKICVAQDIHPPRQMLYYSLHERIARVQRFKYHKIYQYIGSVFPVILLICVGNQNTIWLIIKKKNKKYDKTSKNDFFAYRWKRLRLCRRHSKTER